MLTRNRLSSIPFYLSVSFYYVNETLLITTVRALSNSLVIDHNWPSQTQRECQYHSVNYIMFLFVSMSKPRLSVLNNGCLKIFHKKSCKRILNHIYIWGVESWLKISLPSPPWNRKRLTTHDVTPCIHCWRRRVLEREEPKFPSKAKVFWTILPFYHV